MNSILLAGLVLLGTDNGPPSDDLSRTKIHSYPRTGSEKAISEVHTGAIVPHLIFSRAVCRTGWTTSSDVVSRMPR
jgi:hypothetical protein